MITLIMGHMHLKIVEVMLNLPGVLAFSWFGFWFSSLILSTTE